MSMTTMGLWDSPEFYADKQINEWIQEFQKPENKDKEVLPSIPFGWYTLIHDWRRRQNCES